MTFTIDEIHEMGRWEMIGTLIDYFEYIRPEDSRNIEYAYDSVIAKMSWYSLEDIVISILRDHDAISY